MGRLLLFYLRSLCFDTAFEDLRGEMTNMTFLIYRNAQMSWKIGERREYCFLTQLCEEI